MRGVGWPGVFAAESASGVWAVSHNPGLAYTVASAGSLKRIQP